MANALARAGVVIDLPVAASATISKYDLLNWDATKTGVERAGDTSSEIFAGVALEDFDYSKYPATHNWSTYTAGDVKIPVCVEGVVAVEFDYTSNPATYWEKVYVKDHDTVQEVTDATNDVLVGVYIGRYTRASGGDWVYDVTVETDAYINVAFNTIAVAMD